MMRYRITAYFGDYYFSVTVGSMAVAYKHVESIMLSPMYDGFQDNVEPIMDNAMRLLVEMERGTRRQWVVWRADGDRLLTVEAVKSERRNNLYNRRDQQSDGD